jgi:hypothetical protein
MAKSKRAMEILKVTLCLAFGLASVPLTHWILLSRTPSFETSYIALFACLTLGNVLMFGVLFYTDDYHYKSALLLVAILAFLELALRWLLGAQTEMRPDTTSALIRYKSGGPVVDAGSGFLPMLMQYAQTLAATRLFLEGVHWARKSWCAGYKANWWHTFSQLFQKRTKDPIQGPPRTRFRKR